MVRGSLIGALLAASVLPAAAADLDRPVRRAQRVESVEFWRPAPTAYTTAVVDELFLASKCPRSKDCIAPRVAPVAPLRGVSYRAIPVRVDPRAVAASE